MKKFTVTYEHEVTITYEATVEAENEKEAESKLLDLDIISEYEVDRKGYTIKVLEIEEDN